MKSVFFLAAIATPLIALAEPGGSPFAELSVNRRARPSLKLSLSSLSLPLLSLSLDACNSVASCECTQANYDALGTCLNCLQALAPQLDNFGSPAQDYGDTFYGACSSFGFVLNDITITATPTGIASTGDPLSIFDVPTPTPGATRAVTFQLGPLLPTRAAGSTAKTGGAVGLSAPRSLQAGAVVAVATIAIFMG